MKRIFADTSYYVALISKRDPFHSAATRFASTYEGDTITTQYVVLELGSLFSRSLYRPKLLNLLDDLDRSEYDRILPTSKELFDAGLEIFRNRADKDWSLTDCISFAAMDQLELVEALTTDHHFQQAGYRSLLLELDR